MAESKLNGAKSKRNGAKSKRNYKTFEQMGKERKQREKLCKSEVNFERKKKNKRN